MNIATLLGILPVVGVAAGLAGARFRRAPLVAAAFVLVIYGLLVLSGGVWAATCWDCGGQAETRGEIFFVTVIFFGLLSATTLLGIWLGARMGMMLGRLRQTWRELRGRE